MTFTVVIGRMVITPSREGHVWLSWVDNSEGMEVSEDKLAKALEAFYGEHF